MQIYEIVSTEICSASQSIADGSLRNLFVCSKFCVLFKCPLNVVRSTNSLHFKISPNRI